MRLIAEMIKVDRMRFQEQIRRYEHDDGQLHSVKHAWKCKTIGRKNKSVLHFNQSQI